MKAEKKAVKDKIDNVIKDFDKHISRVRSKASIERVLSSFIDNILTAKDEFVEGTKPPTVNEMLDAKIKKDMDSIAGKIYGLEEMDVGELYALHSDYHDCHNKASSYIVELRKAKKRSKGMVKELLSYIYTLKTLDDLVDEAIIQLNDASK